MSACVYLCACMCTVGVSGSLLELSRIFTFSDVEDKQSRLRLKLRSFIGGEVYGQTD